MEGRPSSRRHCPAERPRVAHWPFGYCAVAVPHRRCCAPSRWRR